MAKSSSMLSSQTILYALSPISVVLLLGGLVVNGALWAEFIAWWDGEFAPGIPCYRQFTHIPVIEQLSAVFVTFWDPIIREGASRLQARMLCATLQTLGMWAAIENTRAGDSRKPWLIRHAPFLVFIWGGCGVACFLSLYLAVELAYRQKNADPTIAVSKAKSLVPAIIGGLMYPYMLMLFPGSQVTASQRQTFIVFYHFSPFFVYAIIQSFGSFLSPKIGGVEAKKNSDARMVKWAYALTGLWSGTAYLTTLLLCLFSNNPEFTLGEIFVPNFSFPPKPRTNDALIKAGSGLFMRLDYWIVVISVVIYVAKTAEMMWMGGPVKMRSLQKMRGSVIIASAGAFLATLVLGPGTVGSAVLYMRENRLREWREEEEKGIAVSEKN